MYRNTSQQGSMIGGQNKSFGFGTTQQLGAGKTGGFTMGQSGVTSPVGNGFSGFGNSSLRVSPSSMSGLGSMGTFGQSQSTGLGSQSSAFGTGMTGNRIGFGQPSGLGAAQPFGAGGATGMTGFGTGLGGGSTTSGFGVQGGAGGLGVLGSSFGGNGFGAQATAANPAAPFGAPASFSATGFGASATGGGGLMGGGMNFGGTTSLGGFGAATATNAGATPGMGFGVLGAGLSGGFGAGSGLNLGQTSAFGGGLVGGGIGAAGVGFGGMQTEGTGNPPFQVVTLDEKGPNNMVYKGQVISLMKQYEGKSLEELRFEDYKKRQGGSAAPAFGQAQSSPFSAFGASPAPAPGAGGLFGGSVPGFGQQQQQPQTAMGMFSATPTTSGFGQFGLGSAAPAPAPATGFGFGTGMSGFGASPAPAPAGASAFGFGVGAGAFKPAAAPASTGFAGFGSPAPAPAAAFTFGTAAPAPAAAFGFGAAPAPAAASAFGFGKTPAPAAASGFGSTGTSVFGGFGSFGTAPANAFGAAPGSGTSGFGGGFGSFGAGFGASAATAPTQAQFAVQQPLQGGLDRKIDALRKKDELEIRLKDDKLAVSSSRQGAPAQSSAPDIVLEHGPGLYQIRRTVRAPRVNPRGYGESRPIDTSAMKSLSASSAVELGATTAFLRPNTLLSRKNKRLILGPSDPASLDNVSTNGIDVTPGSPTQTLLLPPPPPQSSDIRQNGLTPSRGTVALQDNAFSWNKDYSARDFSKTHLLDSRRDVSGDPTGLTPANTKSPIGSASIDSTEELVSPQLKSPAVSTPNIQRRNTLQIESITPGQIVSAVGGGLRSAPLTGDLTSPEFTNRAEGLAGNMAPTLTMPGYITKPASIETLQLMSPSELAHVENFCVERIGFGRIEWEGTTDVRGLNLDNIVVIKKKTVQVYHDSEKCEKPPEGFGLNKPAIITLFKVLPKEDTPALQQLHFEATLRETCQCDGADFIDYNPITGVWSFRVVHFSRYGLVESDDEDSTVPSRKVTTRAIGAESRPTATPGGDPASKAIGASGRTLATPLSKLRQVRALRLQDDSKDHFVTKSPRRIHFDTITPIARNEQLGEDEIRPSAVRLIPDSLFQNLSSDQTEILVEADDESSRSRGFVDLSVRGLNSSSCMTIMKQVREQQFVARGIVVQGSASLTRASATGETNVRTRSRIIDYALAMGRSFRVGWGPNGQIVHAGLPLGSTADTTFENISGVVSIESVDLLAWSQEQFALSYGQTMVNSQLLHESSLMAIQRNAVAINPAMDYSGSLPPSTPLWQVPLCNASELSEYSRFLGMLSDYKQLCADRYLPPYSPEWIALKAVELTSAAVGQEEGFSGEAVEQMPPLESRSGISEYLWERRQEALSQWLQGIAGTRVDAQNSADDGSFGQQEPTFMRIFSLLSVHRISDAVSVAESSGLFRLALLLSQVDGDDNLGLLIRKQLINWQEMQGDSYTCFPQELLDIYRLLGALPLTFANLDDITLRYDRSILANLGPYCAIGIFLWYGRSEYFSDCVSPIAGAFLQYDQAVQLGEADKPSPWYASTDEVVNEGWTGPDDSLYSFFRLLFTNRRHADLQPLIISCLYSEGITRDPLDYRTSFLLLTLMESCGLLADDDTPSYACIVRSHFLAQLLAVGLWKWAAFVAMMIKDDFQRSYLVKEIILRYANADVNWTESSDQHRQTDESFLVNTLRVPAAWIHESAAFRCGIKFDYFRQVNHLNFAGSWMLANEILVEKLAPLAILKSTAAEEQLRTLLEAMNPVRSDYDSTFGDSQTNPYSRSKFLLYFLQLRADMDEIRTAGDAINVHTQEQLQQRARNLLYHAAQIYFSQNEKDRLWHDRSEIDACPSTVLRDFDTALHDISSFLFELSDFSLDSISGEEQELFKMVWQFAGILDAHKVRFIQSQCESSIQLPL